MMKLCSAVMPTRGRESLAMQAVDVFVSQTYPYKELVILDDFDQPSFPNGIEGENIRYYRTENIIYSIPEKRNRVNALALGEIIWHLDSDDWSCAERMERQVDRLMTTKMAVTGYRSLWFYQESTDRAFEYRGAHHYACGSSLCYLKSFWKDHYFLLSHRTGSDNRFVDAAHQARLLDSAEGGDQLIARIHDSNTSRKNVKDSQYVERLIEDLPVAFPRRILAAQ